MGAVASGCPVFAIDLWRALRAYDSTSSKTCGGESISQSVLQSQVTNLMRTAYFPQGLTIIANVRICHGYDVVCPVVVRVVLGHIFCPVGQPFANGR